MLTQSNIDRPERTRLDFNLLFPTNALTNESPAPHFNRKIICWQRKKERAKTPAGDARASLNRLDLHVTMYQQRLYRLELRECSRQSSHLEV